MKANLARLFAFAGLVVLGLVVGCVAPTPTQPAPATPLAVVETGQLPRMRGDFFSASGECGFCHTALKDSSGQDVSIESSWRASIMANSTRDPYYRASVRSEVLDRPDYAEAIQEKCAVCHIGMAHHTALLTEQSAALLPDAGYLNPTHPLYPLAIDGVSCSLCHQIQGDNFGTNDSFSGGYLFEKEPKPGERAAFGRFAVDENMAAVMRNASGYQPVQSEHVTQSELCAVCHNLYTPYFTNEGKLSTDLFPEQTPQLEWLASEFAKTSSCQTCHMPAAEGEAPIANTGSPKRSPLMQHTFVGGNRYLLELLAANLDALKVSATTEQLEKARLLTLQQLQQNTARLSGNARQEGDELIVDVTVEVLTGHKFPTSFPSRRAWLHMMVKDANGKLVFVSGGWQPDGLITGNDNDMDEQRYEPHYQIINHPDQVQIYEPIIGDPDGKVTTTLLRAQRYLKDNRLLPRGFDKSRVSGDIGVYGEAVRDADFIGGSDTVQYRIKTAGFTAPFKVEIELLYQSFGYRWAEKFRGQTDNPEGVEFYGYLASLPNTPSTIHSITLTSPTP
jgi:mono/diheme cytochrome c family protein